MMKRGTGRPVLNLLSWTGVCGDYRVLAFQTQDKGWVKVRLIPFKEKILHLRHFNVLTQISQRPQRARDV